MGTIIRIVALLAMKLFGLITHRDNVVWLAHYLLGSGKDRTIGKRHARLVASLVDRNAKEGVWVARFVPEPLHSVVGTAAVRRVGNMIELRDVYDWHVQGNGEWNVLNRAIMINFPCPIRAKTWILGSRPANSKDPNQMDRISVVGGRYTNILVSISDAYWVDKGKTFVTHMSTPID